MIETFASKETKKVFDGYVSRRLPAEIQDNARELLRILDAAANLGDLRRVPGNHLEKLSGDRKGQHSIRINRQWRICFRWNRDRARDVEITNHYN